jgi:hypothetical protein
MCASIFFTAAMIRAYEVIVAMVGLTVYVSPLPHDLADLKARIIAVVKNIDAPMLTRVWQELEYHIDVRCVTLVAHIERL